MPAKRGKEWEGVKIIEKARKRGEHPRVECLFCGHEWTGGATKHRQHWIRQTGSEVAECKPSTDAKRTALSEFLSALKDARRSTSKKQKTNNDAGPSNTATGSAESSRVRQSEPSRVRQSTLFEANALSVRTSAHMAVSRFFAACGVPYNVADSVYFKDMLKAVATVGGTYQPPHRNTLRTTLLEKERDVVDKALKPVRDCIRKLGCTLTSDGWSDRRSRPLLNFLAVCPEGEMFIEAIDTSNETKTAAYIEKQMSAVIDRHEIAVEDIVHIVTDSASNCRAAGLLLEEKYRHLLWTPCTTHQLDLLSESLGKLNWMSDTIKNGRAIVNFITGRQKSLSLYRLKSSRAGDSAKKELLKPGETRFASSFIMMQRLQEVKDVLRQTVVDEQWRDWLDGKVYEEEGERVADLILSSQFWKSVEEVLLVSEPVVSFLRMTDGRAPIVGKVYYKWFSLIEKFEQMNTLTANKRECIVTAAKGRWEKAHTIIHSVGYCLDPEYRSHDQYSNGEVKKNFKLYLKKCYPDAKMLADAEAQYREYKSSVGDWTSPTAVMNASSMPGHLWWEEYCSDLPLIQRPAMRVLAQCSSSSSCERVWSTFEFVHSKKRNRLTSKRLNDLVFVHYNLRLLQQRTNQSTKDAFVPWDEEESEPEDDSSESESEFEVEEETYLP